MTNFIKNILISTNLSDATIEATVDQIKKNQSYILLNLLLVVAQVCLVCVVCKGYLWHYT